MKKIMFNDKYGLTDAVLKGYKTMTRRIVNPNILPKITEMRVLSNGTCQYEDPYIGKWYNCSKRSQPKYKVGEVVAVAQNYESMANGGYLDRMTVPADNAVGFEFKPEYCGAGYTNKMFVKAEWMPHRIRITDIKVERLQDISDEDCLKEGIMMDPITGWYYVPNLYLHRKKKNTASPTLFEHPKAAYCTLCKKLGVVLDNSANPWVFAYTFELEGGARP